MKGLKHPFRKSALDMMEARVEECPLGSVTEFCT